MHPAAGYRELSLARSAGRFGQSGRKTACRGEEECVCSPYLGLTLSESV